MDVERAVRLAQLLDCYGGILTSRQRESLHLYCEEDFSLGEVAAYFGTSRQAVHDCLQRGTQALEQADASLGLLLTARKRADLVARAMNVLGEITEEVKGNEAALSGLEELAELLERLRQVR